MAKNLGDLYINCVDGIIDVQGNRTLNVDADISIDNTRIVQGNPSLLFSGISQPTITTNEYSDLSLGSNNFTVDFWAFMESVYQHNGAGGTAISHKSGPSYAEISIEIKLNYNTISLYMGGPDVSIGTIVPFTASTWHHVAITRNGSNFYIFMDGNLYRTINSSNSLNNVVAPFTIGTFQDNLGNIRVINGEALWTEDFNLTPEELGYENSAFRLMSSIYNEKTNPSLRGQAKAGFIRPTIKQFFTSYDWEAVNSITEIPATWENGIVASTISITDNGTILRNAGQTGVGGVGISNPATPIKDGKWAWSVYTYAGGSFGIAAIPKTSTNLSDISNAWHTAAWEDVYWSLFLDTNTGAFEINKTWGTSQGVQLSTTVSLPSDDYGYVLYWYDDVADGFQRITLFWDATYGGNSLYTDYTRGLMFDVD